MAKDKTLKYNISFVRGDTFAFTFDISSSIQEDLTSAYMTCKEKDDPEGTAKFHKKIGNGITKISTGKYRVQLERADTINLDVDGQYKYDVEIKYGNVIKTILNGDLSVSQDYTNPDDED